MYVLYTYNISGLTFVQMYKKYVQMLNKFCVTLAQVSPFGVVSDYVVHGGKSPDLRSLHSHSRRSSGLHGIKAIKV